MTRASLIATPLLPVWLLATLAAIALALGLYGLIRGARGSVFRLLALAVLLGWLTGPQWLTQSLRAVPMQALVVLDRSHSMATGNRATDAQEIAAALRAEADHIPGLSLKFVDAGAEPGHGTRLFAGLDRADIAPGRFAGAVMVTDGEVDDVPRALPDLFRDQDGHALPLFALLTARGEETDRRLRILQAPPFAIVGQTATLRVQVDDMGPVAHAPATLTLTRSGEPPIVRDVQPGVPQDIPVPISHPGETLVGLSVSALPGEVSQENNRAVVRINGVRDRLRVLLVSGAPNQGERVWRRLLKADPSVDLVHFTILRPGDKEDDTPNSDLALIPFPVRELFADKIRQFDLIILDGFQNRGILPQVYLQNIADFVRGGGGLLLTAGPEFTQPGTLQDGPLADILPAHIPEDGLVQQKFTPTLSETGARHPVTEGLPGAPVSITAPPGWGPWYRDLRSDEHRGEVLMNGADGQPLLILDHVEQGRVALLLSDQIWLWSRGEAGGGPQAELLRRLAHWLMKEPELEENQLSASIADGHLSITRRSAGNDAIPPAIVTAPDGRRTEIRLTGTGHGFASARLAISDTFGIWTVTCGSLTAYAAPMGGDPLELADLRATASRLAPVVDASHGASLFVPSPDGTPALRLAQPGGAASGPGWISFPQRLSRIPGAAHTTPLLPAWVAMALILCLTMLGWWREGRRR
jgi:hypothetical protein